MAKSAPTFYVFHGTDEFTMSETVADFKSRLGPPDTVDLNTTEFDGRSLTLAELRHACDSIPFLAEKRLILVTGLLTRLTSGKGGKPSGPQKELLSALVEYVPELPETTRLVFLEDRDLPASHPVIKLAQGKGRGYVKQFSPPESRALPSWIERRVQRYGGQIEPQAAHQLAAVVGTDLRLLDQEIEKLVTYTNAERAIGVADVEVLVPYAQAAVVFDMVDGLGRRDGRTAAQTLHRLLESGEHPLGLLAMVVRQFRLLIQVKELRDQGSNAASIAKALGIHPYPARKLFNQATYFTSSQMEVVFRHLLDVDVAIKSGEIDAEVALDLLVAGLAAAD